MKYCGDTDFFVWNYDEEADVFFMGFHTKGVKYDKKKIKDRGIAMKSKIESLFEEDGEDDFCAVQIFGFKKGVRR